MKSASSKSDHEASGVTLVLVLSTLMAVLGSTFQFGYNTGVINVPQKFIKQFYNETWDIRWNETMSGSQLDLYWGMTVSIFAVGGMFGSLCAGVLVAKMGLKKSFLLNNLLAIPAALLMGLSKPAGSYELLILGRLLIGINSGINMGIAPMYLTEIAPVKLRGIFGVLTQLGVVSSILLSQILGLQNVMGTEDCWPYLLAFTGVFSVLQLLIVPFCPESPRYLYLTRNRPDLAERSLRSLRGPSCDLSQELGSMKNELNSNPGKTINLSELFTQTRYKWPLIIAVVMQLSQQLSGINAVFYYSTPLFAAMGLTTPEYCTLGVGVVNVVMTLVSLSLIEKAGRKVLHLVGMAGMCICAVIITVLLEVQLGDSIEESPLTVQMNSTTAATPVAEGSVAWFGIVPVLLFVVFFQVGPGAIPWFITAELFNQQSRPTAVAVAGVVNWLGNFAVGLLFPVIQSSIEGFSFLIFAALLAIFWLFTFFKVPETKGKDIDKITAMFEVSANEDSNETLIAKSEMH